MRGSRLVVLLWALLGGAPAWAGPQDAPPEPMVREALGAVYRLYYDGLPMGEVTERWERNGAHYRIHSEAHPYPVVHWLAPSFAESSEGAIAEGVLRPDRFEHRRSDDPQPMIAQFLWDRAVLVQHFDGRTETFPLAPLTQDMLSIKYLYRVGDDWIDRDLPMATGKRVEIHHFVLQETVPLVTEAGRFRTRHLADRGDGSPSHFDLWLAEDRRYPPVRLQVTERGNRWEQRLLRVEFE